MAAAALPILSLTIILFSHHSKYPGYLLFQFVEEYLNIGKSIDKWSVHINGKSYLELEQAKPPLSALRPSRSELLHGYSSAARFLGDPADTCTVKVAAE